MTFMETSRHKSTSNMHTKLANQHFCKIPKNQADLHFMIFDVVIRIAIHELLILKNLLNSQNDISSENEKQQTQHVKIV